MCVEVRDMSVIHIRSAQNILPFLGFHDVVGLVPVFEREARVKYFVIFEFE